MTKLYTNSERKSIILLKNLENIVKLKKALQTSILCDIFKKKEKQEVKHMENYPNQVYKPRELRDFKDLLNQTVKRYPNSIAYEYKKWKNEEEFDYVTKSYEEFQNDVQAFSTSLLQLGLEHKKIALISDNRYEWCTTYLAVTTGNMIIVPLDKALPSREIESLIQRSGAEAVVFEKKYLEEFQKIQAEKIGNLKYFICMDSVEDASFLSYQDLLQQGATLIGQGNSVYETREINPKDMSIMLFTSGTTSEAKAVMLSQYNICENIRGVASYVQMFESDVLLSFLPLHHTFECTITFLYGIYFGVTVAFCDGLKYIAQNLKEYGVTVFVAVPLVLENMYKKIQKEIEKSGKASLIATMKKISNGLLKYHVDLRKLLFKPVLKKFDEKLRVVFYGAAPMNKQTILGYNEMGIELIQGYGLTETSPVIACETDKRKMPGSVGFPLVNLEVKIDSPNEEGIGEIAVKGPSVMAGYYQNEEATQKVLKDGWFFTGDYGYLDEQGFLYVTGRKNDVIVLRNGKNIYPQELEFLISKLDYVKESMVYGKDRKNADTLICAKIVYEPEKMQELFPDKKEEEYPEIVWKDIKKINEELPIFKHIKDITLTTEPLIKTTTQKVKRYQEMQKVKKD